MFKQDIGKFGALIGHSFIRNISRYCRDQITLKDRWTDIQLGRVTENELNAQILRVNDHYLSIDIEWVYLYDSPEWHDAVRYLLAMDRDTAIVNMGSNNLCEIIRATQDDSEDAAKARNLAGKMITEAVHWQNR